jgi:hypothetical protein
MSDSPFSSRARVELSHGGRSSTLGTGQGRRCCPQLALPGARELHSALTAKTVREAAFKYNGVANFCGFLAALPADVGVLDKKLGRTRALVKGGRVIPKNVAWLRKSKQARRT